MIVRLAMLATASLTAVGGLTASAYSITQGATDQAIAFGWPTLAIALAIVMLAPSRRGRANTTDAAIDQGS
jgi:hypothetical protein